MLLPLDEIYARVERRYPGVKVTTASLQEHRDDSLAVYLRSTTRRERDAMPPRVGERFRYAACPWLETAVARAHTPAIIVRPTRWSVMEFLFFATRLAPERHRQPAGGLAVFKGGVPSAGWTH